jgi:hypothetical protein
MFGLVLLLITLGVVAAAFSMGVCAVLVRSKSVFSPGTAFAWGVIAGPLGVAVVAFVGRKHTGGSSGPPLLPTSTSPVDKF